jgi:glycosyltransferase involved in cell wall biosynthesis
MRWSIVAPFFRGGAHHAERDFTWIDDAVPQSAHTFTKIPVPYEPGADWHARAVRDTPLEGWKRIWKHALSGWNSNPDGLISVFPQLAAAAGAQKRLLRKDIPLVAWCFNVGARPTQARRFVARQAFKAVDHFVVHSRAELATASSWFGIPAERISFVPLQAPHIPAMWEEEQASPFIVSMGSANRDYSTFLKAVAGLPIRVIIVAGPRALDGLNLPANVEFQTGLPAWQCWKLAQQAKACVVPLKDVPTGAGQVTVVEALQMARPVIATRGAGTIDYVDHGKTGLLVDAGNVEQLRAEIIRLWEDDELRLRLSEAGKSFAEVQLSDAGAARSLMQILDSVT